MSSIVHPLLGLHGFTAYLVIAALCFGEVALFVGFVLPGEIAVIYGGVLASMGHVNIVVLVVLVVVCAIAGNVVGYEIGRRFGPFLLTHRPLKGHPGVERSRALVEERGAYAVFFGRFIAVVRALVPGVAGLSELPYRRFLVANVASGLIWGSGYSLAGYAAGRSYEKVVSGASTVSFVVLGALVVVGLSVFVLRKVRERRARVPGGTAGES